ncbi:UpxY family transcription antiterminator [Gelidibacter maritimus]|uniref:UpxY family transcription antiterminator n=1 Tax=Gelidibacter maritimus TaxID=2761487 RepID=A0A7W2M655_9FLAO|nr:UpxY family transcription antiterminator [Gelidibacter maritimus]MBA6153428.1 UpxY family transcription antiterminator [Gelidibacter maritimus]
MNFSYTFISLTIRNLKPSKVDLMPWYVLITKPKHELKVAERLTEAGFEVCCPTRVEVRQWSDRKKKVTVPLLPSMVLVNCAEKDRAQVFLIPGAVRYLFWLGEPAVVPAKEVQVLKDIASQKQQVISTEKIEIGQEIDLKQYGLTAKKGTVKYISGNQCWVVLHQLGYVIKLKIK